MGLGIETIHAYVTATAVTTEQLLVAGTGQSLSIRASNPNAAVYLDSVWGNVDDLAQLSIRSPRMHDNTKGILAEIASGNQSPVLDEYFAQALYSQDTLTVGATFPAAPTAGHLEGVGMNVVYSDIPGINAALRTWAEVQPNIIEYVGVATTPSSAATTGSWGAGAPLNSTYDLLKANQLYAVLGYQVSAPCTCVALQGPDIGNLLFGGPGSPLPIETRRWFVEQSLENGRPYIPVINSANKQSTQAFVASAIAGAAVPITWLMARLSA